MLWTLDSESVQPVKWNDDWDSSPIIIGDYMIVGSESSRFWVVKLNRSYDAAGLVQVAPEVVFTDEAWDEEVLAANGDDARVGRELGHRRRATSPTSAPRPGSCSGYDLSRPRRTARTPTQVFRFYTAGDNDASLVVDDEGMLYVAGAERPPGRPRAAEVGQLTEARPEQAGQPDRVELQRDRALKGQGIYGTPAVVGDIVVVTSDGGRLIGLDRDTGAVLWERTLAGPAWGSPVVVDDVLLIGDCLTATSTPSTCPIPTVAPPELWSVNLGGCIEATPAVWKGRIYIGTRAGHLYTLGVAPPAGYAAAAVVVVVVSCVVVVVVMSTGLSCQRYSRRVRPLSMTSAASSRPDVPQVPGLVVVAGAVRGIERVAEQEPVLVGVGGDPLARRAWRPTTGRRRSRPRW